VLPQHRLAQCFVATNKRAKSANFGDVVEYLNSSDDLVAQNRGINRVIIDRWIFEERCVVVDVGHSHF